MIGVGIRLSQERGERRSRGHKQGGVGLNEMQVALGTAMVSWAQRNVSPKVCHYLDVRKAGRPRDRHLGLRLLLRKLR